MSAARNQRHLGVGGPRPYGRGSVEPAPPPARKAPGPRRGSALFFIVVAWLPLAASVFRVWVHQDAVQLGYALSVQERRHEALRADLHALEVEVAAARSPARLMQVARQLGLRPPAAGELQSGRPPAHLARAGMGEGAHASP